MIIEVGDYHQLFKIEEYPERVHKVVLFLI